MQKPSRKTQDSREIANGVISAQKLGQDTREQYDDLSKSKSFIQCSDGCAQYEQKGVPGIITDTTGKGITPENTTSVHHEDLNKNGNEKNNTPE